MRIDIFERKKEIMEMIEKNEPKSNICKMLNCKPVTLENYLKKMSITYKGNMGLKGKKTSNKRKTAIQYLEKEIVAIPKLRKKLIEDGIKSNQCEICELSEWMGQKIPLELHHIDGDRFNNKLENLQILCPNCHSLTPNHSGKKYKMKKKKTEKKENKCNCGKVISRGVNRCVECHHKLLRINRPERDQLINDVKDLGYSATGRKYGVSDNAIRKWLKYYNGPIGELV